MEYWNALLSSKSWEILQELKKKPFKFILIGEWATYLWNKLNKSKDIDIIIADYKSLDYLKTNFNLIKNDHLKKYEIKIEEVDIDVYVQFYSNFSIPIEEIKKQTTKIEGITVVKPECLVILKQQAEIDRGESVKGQKDRIDIMNLLCFTQFDFLLYYKLLKKYHLSSFSKRLKKIITNFHELKYLELSPLEFKKKKGEIIKKLQA